MKIKYFLSHLLFICFFTSVSQTVNTLPLGAYCASCTPKAPAKKGNGGQQVMNGNESVATVYTVTACGLNYISANLPLYQRGFSFGPGVAQPAPFVVSGIPACGKIYKAFLYTAGESNGATAINATIVNPQNTTGVFPMSIIGVAADKNWGYANSYGYRADITSIITGNGTYSLSGLPTGSPTDVNGASLFIIYTDESQNYTGSIVIADGMMSNTGPGGDPLNITIAGFNVCGTPNLTQNFMVVDDLQQITNFNISLNTTTSTVSFTEPAASQVPWMLFSQPGTPAVAGQNSANYGAYSGSDAFGIVMVGMYFRTTCLTCPVPLSLTATSQLCTGNASVVTQGNVNPPTYTWTGSAQTTSAVTGLALGQHTVTVNDGCKTTKATVNITMPSTITVPSSSVCIGSSTTMIVNGPANSTYTWTPGSLNTTTSATVIANPTVTTNYTVTSTNSLNCPSSATTQLVVIPKQPITITNTGTTCVGFSNTLTPVGPQLSYTWSPAATLNATNTASTIATPTITTIYTLAATNASGCVNTGTSQVLISGQPTTLNTGTVCIGYSTTLTAVNPSSNSSFTWSPGATLNTTVGNSVSATPLTNTSYTVVTTNTAGCVITNTTQVFVVPTQTISIANPTTCLNQNLNLTASSTYTGNNYSWTGPNAFSSSVQNPVIPNATIPMSGTYSLVVISAPGCTTSAFANATVFPIPSPSIASNAPICPGSTLSMTASASGTTAVSYIWSGPNGFGSNIATPSIVNSGTVNSGIYTLTATFPTGCSATVTKSLQVKPLPVVLFNTNSPVCVGSALTFTAGGGDTYKLSGPNGFSTAATSATINNVQPVNAGTYTLTVSLASCSVTTNTLVVVNPLPTPTATNSSPVCATHSLQLTGTGGVDYYWYGPNTYSSAVQNPTMAAAQMTNAGVYTLTVVDGNNCQASAVTTVTVLPNPVIVATGSVVCYGSPGTLTVTGGAGYSWTGPAGFTSSLATPTVSPVNSATSGEYTVTVSGANSCTSTATASLQTTPQPTVVATSTAACFNAIATLSANGATTYTWTGPNAYLSTTQNAIIFPANATTTGIYTVVATWTNTCRDTTTATLSTIPLPNIVPTSTIVCLNERAVLLANGGVAGGYSWTGPNGYNAATQNATITSANSAAVTNYTVVGTAPNTCTNSAVASLSTVPLPTVVATPTVICYNEPFTMTVTGASTYTWSGPGGYSATGGTAFIANVTNTTPVTYTVVGMNPAPFSCTNIGTAVINTMPLPTITAVGDTVCFGQPAVLSAYGGLSTGYTWTGPNFTSNLPNAYITSANSAVPVTYSVVGTAANTCTNITTTQLVTRPLPIPTFTAPSRLCFNSTLIMKAGGAATYTWTGPYAYYSTSQNVAIPMYNMLQAGTYSLSVQDKFGCYNDTTLAVKIDPLPDGTLISDNNKYCVPFCSSFWLDNNTNSAVVGTSWLINNHILAKDTFPACITNLQQNIAIGTFTNALGCVNTITFTIPAHQTPQADYTFSPERPIEEIDNVMFTNTSNGDKQSGWNWYFINNKGYVSSSENPSCLFNDAGAYQVALVVSNIWGCADTVVKTITVNSDFKIYVPNTFTPNGDGVNDIFQPKGRGIKKYLLSIYDRWGNKVFSSEDFNTGWDGTEKGAHVTDDIYVWKINYTDANGQISEMTGHVLLAR